jgi:phosphoglucomutase
MLIGFKYIGELILNKENTTEKFVIGGEESYGLLKGTYARDKDGAAGALPLAEYAAELKQTGLTLRDRLFELYSELGVYIERLDTVKCEGAAGFTQMQTIMDRLRSDPLTTVGSHRITKIHDYKTLIATNLETNEKQSIDCASGNVFVMEFGDRNRRITVRPSGTEPKLKLYVQWHEKAKEDVINQYYDLERYIEGLSKELEGMLLS